MFKIKLCVNCGCEFTPKGPAGKYCESCPPKTSTSEYKRAATARHRKKLGHEVGVGSGNSSKNRGRTHSQYKNGWTSYKELGRKLKESLQKCQRCEKDLTLATKWQWVCHHKDHDRTNSDVSNLEILCKSCHQIEHECWKAFEGATTIRKE